MQNRRLHNLLGLLLLALLLYATTESAQASFNCGIAPIPPIGCHTPVCICDDAGSCSWYFTCE